MKKVVTPHAWGHFFPRSKRWCWSRSRRVRMIMRPLGVTIPSSLDPDNHHLAVGIAAIPEKIRGFGHVKLRHLAAAKADEATLLDQLRSGAPHYLKAAE